MSWSIQPISAAHILDNFDCGKPALNSWLKRHARQNDLNDISKTQVAVRPGSLEVMGYYSLSAVSVAPAFIPGARKEGVPQSYPTPCILLGRLATDVRARGMGLGKGLLAHALRMVLATADRVGAYAVTVDALDDEARGFYFKHDFTPLLDDPRHLFLPMRKVRQLFSSGD